MLPHAYVEAALARHAAPCLAGIKPANLVSFPSADIQWCDTYNAILNEQGIYFTPLCVCENRTQILVYRKDLLACLCFHPQVVAALQALQVFHQYTECKERFALQIKSGMTIFEIVCAA